MARMIKGFWGWLSEAVHYRREADTNEIVHRLDRMNADLERAIRESQGD